MSVCSVILMTVTPLSALMLNVIMLNAIMLNAILQYVIMLIGPHFSALLLNVSMLCRYAEFRYH